MPNLPACCFPTSDASLAEALYCAYNRGGDEATAGLNFRGEPCPVWSALPENVRAKWEAVAVEMALDPAGDIDSDQILARVGMDFGLALVALKAGGRVRRAGWNGKGMWLALTPGIEIKGEGSTSLRGAARQYADAEHPVGIRIGAHIDMRAADGSLVIGWLASQTDMLATDWDVVE